MDANYSPLRNVVVKPRCTGEEYYCSLAQARKESVMNKARSQFSENNYRLQCIQCGTMENVTLMPHRVDGGVVGVMVMCVKCFPKYASCDMEVHFLGVNGTFSAPKEKVDSHGEK